MSYTLIISEKPNAAQNIAYALSEGKMEKISKGGVAYYKVKNKGKDIIVVPAAGHLFILTDKNQKPHHKWTYPVFDVEWRPTYTNKESIWAKKFFINIEKLAKGASDFISACDYDTEGSVIAYNILRFICKTEKAKRMKFSTLTKQDLIESYENASPKLDFPQIEAGLARHYLDWYFGINLSRALTLALEHSGGYWTLSTGRVQGPTLGILEKRQKEIESFKTTPFWEVGLEGLVDGKEIKALHEKEKFWKKEEASDVLKKCKGKKGVVEDVEKKEHKQFPPFPFDLTTLQRDSYHLFGYSPKVTLDIAQSLYEQALISYPRTSSQKLPPKIGYKHILTRLSEQKEYADSCKKVLDKGFLRPNQGKKDDPAHPSIFPTGNKPQKLSKYQKNLYDLIVRRFLSVFGDPALRETTKIVTDVNGEKFVTHGTRTVESNWMELYKPYARFKDDTLPAVKKGDSVKVEKLEMADKETEPPERYSQASILKEMEDLGLGTKATRAQILHTLYERDYIKETSIIVTELGQAVVTALEKYCPEIVSIELTKKFEEDAEEIEKGERKKEEIIKSAESELVKILSRFKTNEAKIGKEILGAIKNLEKVEHTIGKCDKCGGDLKLIHSRRTKKRFIGCSGYPKCKNSFPLPQKGGIKVMTEKCKDCGLFKVMIITSGKRPWKICVKCGFEKYKKELAANAANAQKGQEQAKQAKPGDTQKIAQTAQSKPSNIKQVQKGKKTG